MNWWNKKIIHAAVTPKVTKHISFFTCFHLKQEEENISSMIQNVLWRPVSWTTYVRPYVYPYWFLSQRPASSSSVCLSAVCLHMFCKLLFSFLKFLLEVRAPSRYKKCQSQIFVKNSLGSEEWGIMIPCNLWSVLNIQSGLKIVI